MLIRDSITAPTLKRISFLIGILLAGLVLHFHVSDSKEVRYDQLALGTENQEALGVVEGRKVHCHDMQDIQGCLDAYTPFRDSQKTTLWLGNSQLHAINQIKPGEQPSSALLHQQAQEKHRYLLTLSQPNANLQEHYLLLAYALGKLPVDTLILPVVFDDMRETGIRPSLSGALKDSETKATLKQTEVGKSIISIHGDQDSAGNDMSALNDTVQERSEHFLNKTLAQFWAVWADREQLRGELTLSLYQFRNWILGINPSTTRKMIPGRYVANLDAFKAILTLTANKGVKTLVYIVPVRNDITIPYAPAEYAQFKQEIARLAAESGTAFANLEDIVPAEFWGTKDATTVGGGQEADFMHFQAPGHALLARCLNEELTTLWNGGRRP